MKLYNLNLLRIYLVILSNYVDGAFINSPCHVSGSTMYCEHGDIPTDVSPEIRGLFIEGLSLTNIEIFRNQTFREVQKLDIQLLDSVRNVPPKSFEGLKNLTYLGLHGKMLSNIDQDAFLGLDNLKVLNMSFNPILYVHRISRAINSEYRRVLPNLVVLSLAKLKSVISGPVMLSKYFFQSISIGRTLRHLDLSGIYLDRFDLADVDVACSSVEYVDLRQSFVGHIAYSGRPRPCRSLKTLDLRKTVIPTLRFKLILANVYFTCDFLVFYAYVENILANQIIIENEINIPGYFLNMSMCPLRIRKVDFSRNKLRIVNMTVQLHGTTKYSLSNLNFSYSGLEYFSPEALSPSENLEIFDLSNNKLGVMQVKYRADFEALFQNNMKLLYLNLSHNSLSAIPENTFLNNKLLRVLDISFNNIKILDFSVTQLQNMEKLVATYNSIHAIHEKVREGFYSIWSSGNLSEANTTREPFYVYLTGNRFMCTCDRENLNLIDWLHSTVVINNSEVITCKLDGKEMNIKNRAPEETKHFCKMQVIKKAVSISTPLAITTIVLSLGTLFIMRRRRKKKQQFLSFISQIEKGSFPLPYLAFLSYCSEDRDLVIDKVYPQLCKNLAEMTHSSKLLVCCGDNQFRPGFALRYEVMRCVEESSVFIAVVSERFCHKTWCNLEIGWAYDQNKPIIMLMVEHVEKSLMDRFLQKVFDRYAHASWVPDNNGGHIEPDWKIFCTSVVQLAGKVHQEQ